jgi:hypothetical protein
MVGRHDNTLLFVYLSPQARLQGGLSNSNETPKGEVVKEASSYGAIESWVYPAHDQRSNVFLKGGALRDFSMDANLPIRPEWQLGLENQAEW